MVRKNTKKEENLILKLKSILCQVNKCLYHLFEFIEKSSV